MDWRILFREIVIGTAKNILFCSLLLVAGFGTLSLIEWRNMIDWTKVAGTLYAVGALSGAWVMWNYRGHHRLRFLDMRTLQAAIFSAGNAIAWTLSVGVWKSWEWSNIRGAALIMGALSFCLVCLPFSIAQSAE